MNAGVDSQVWQSNGALEILLSALLRVENGTRMLLEKDSSITAQGRKFVTMYVEPLSAAGFTGSLDEVLAPEQQAELAHINLALFNLVASLSCDLRTAILMAAIDLEAMVNQFLVLHLSERIVESIDRQSVNNKLTIAQAILSIPDFHDSPEEKALNELFDWRNAFAHGKLPGFKKNLSLKSLHLKSVEDLGVANPQDELRTMIKLLNGYLLVRRYLQSIATKPPVFSSPFDLTHVEQVLQRIMAIKQVKFKDWYLTDTEKRQYAEEKQQMKIAATSEPDA